MDQIIRSLPVLLEALQQTLVLSGLAVVFSAMLGFAIGEVSTLAGPVAGWFVRRYIELVSGIPLLLSPPGGRRADRTLLDGGHVTRPLLFCLRSGNRAWRCAIDPSEPNQQRARARHAPS